MTSDNDDGDGDERFRPANLEEIERWPAVDTIADSGEFEEGDETEVSG